MKIKNWILFIKERFDPISHFLMLLVFVSVHVLLVVKLEHKYITYLKMLFLFLGVTLFYFKLRLYDEIKDYELDVVINPMRPLPRGLLKHNDIFKGIFICIILELITFSSQGINSTLSIIIAIFYSLLMFKEFFIKELIRPLLTTYAVSHTVVTSLLTFAIFTFLTSSHYNAILTNKNYVYFALTNWMLFNIFEFGRKTFLRAEERVNVDTYSSLFGKKGAVLLVVIQALISFLLIININAFDLLFIKAGLGILNFFLICLASLYIFSEKIKFAKLYRFMSSFYIILFYLILIVGLIIN